jgi:hypothetical protein
MMKTYLTPLEWHTCLLVCKPKVLDLLHELNMWSAVYATISKMSHIIRPTRPSTVTMTWMSNQNKDYEASYLACHAPTSPRLQTILEENTAPVYRMDEKTRTVQQQNQLNMMTTREAIGILAITFHHVELFQDILVRYNQVNITQVVHFNWMMETLRCDDVECFKILHEHRERLILREELPCAEHSHPLMYRYCTHTLQETRARQGWVCYHEHHFQLPSRAVDFDAIKIMTFFHDLGEIARYFLITLR